MALNLAKTVLEYLKARPDEKLTARQIAEWIFETYPAECQEKKSNSRGNYIKTDADLVQQLVAEISSQRPRMLKRYPELKMTEGRPRKYYYSEKSDVAEVVAAEGVMAAPRVDANDVKLGEHALYPLLSLYLWEEFGVYSKRTDEKRSSNKRGPNGNRWLYPDVVGMEDLGAEWHQEVRDCVNQYSDKRTKLWSFEAKLLINRSNVRECFFQAVSNSSWANFGYLVAAEIEGQDTLKELRMLFAARHRPDQAGCRQPRRKSGLDSSPRKGRNRLGHGQPARNREPGFSGVRETGEAVLPDRRSKACRLGCARDDGLKVLKICFQKLTTCPKSCPHHLFVEVFPNLNVLAP